MFKKNLKKIIKSLGFTIHRYKKSGVFLDAQTFTPFKNSENSRENHLYYEAIKKSKNESTDNFSKRLRYFSLQQLITHTLNQSETFDFVECGCWKGHSAYIISKLINESGKKINFHIFDSFEGLSEATTKDESFYLKDSKEKNRIYKYFASSENIIKDVLKDFNFIKIYKGWIPNRFGEIKDEKFSFIHIDVDLFEPTFESLKFFYPRLKKGGIIVCDDYNFTDFPGAKKAWDEYFKDKSFSIFYQIPFGGCFIIK